MVFDADGEVTFVVFDADGEVTFVVFDVDGEVTFVVFDADGEVTFVVMFGGGDSDTAVHHATSPFAGTVSSHLQPTFSHTSLK